MLLMMNKFKISWHQYYYVDLYYGNQLTAVQPSMKYISNDKKISKVDKKSTGKGVPHVKVICQHSFSHFVQTYMPLRLLQIV